MEPFIATTDPEWTDTTKGPILKARLTGLMVYNLKDDGSTLYPGVYTWNGTQWVTSQVNTTAVLSIAAQPKAFTFYESGTETGSAVSPLTFTVSGGSGNFSCRRH
jgi:hypothetical protein